MSSALLLKVAGKPFLKKKNMVDVVKKSPKSSETIRNGTKNCYGLPSLHLPNSTRKCPTLLVNPFEKLVFKWVNCC
jgi:predicted ATP-grasp superfamily ATP-dependent carboligase